jgi:hypothetical protein
MKIAGVSVILVLGLSVYALDPNDFNVPPPIRSCFDRHNLGARYQLSDRINPFYLRGDFDGDRKLDHAVLVTEIASSKEGIVICETVHHGYAVIGAGTPFSLEGSYKTDDLREFDYWMHYENERISDLTPRADGILLGKAEASSGVIYRRKHKYVWHQLGI